MKVIELEMPESVKKDIQCLRELEISLKILMPKLTEKGPISKEEDHEDQLKKGN